MRNEKTAATVILSLAMWISPGLAFGQSFKIVVNESNSTESMSKQDLSKCFLKQRKTWATGDPIIPVDQAVNSETRKAFSQEIHDRDVRSIKSFWQRQIFSGRDVPPTEKSTDEEVLVFVQSNSGAIGYVSVDVEVGAGVKVLKIAEQ